MCVHLYPALLWKGFKVASFRSLEESKIEHQKTKMFHKLKKKKKSFSGFQWPPSKSPTSAHMCASMHAQTHMPSQHTQLHVLSRNKQSSLLGVLQTCGPKPAQCVFFVWLHELRGDSTLLKLLGGGGRDAKKWRIWNRQYVVLNVYNFVFHVYSTTFCRNSLPAPARFSSTLLESLLQILEKSFALGFVERKESHGNMESS